MNFAPIAAIALCAAAYFPRKYKFTVPMIALLISDIVLDAHYGFSLSSPFVLSHYVGFAIIGTVNLYFLGKYAAAQREIAASGAKFNNPIESGWAKSPVTMR